MGPIFIFIFIWFDSFFNSDQMNIWYKIWKKNASFQTSFLQAQNKQNPNLWQATRFTGKMKSSIWWKTLALRGLAHEKEKQEKPPLPLRGSGLES